MFVSLVLFIYLKEISTTNWCIFNCQTMLRVLLAWIYIDFFWMNYMYDVCFMSQNVYVNFIMQCLFPIHQTLMYHLCQFLIGLTSLIRMSKFNFILMFWILILLYWKRSLLLLLMLVEMKRKPIIKFGKDLTDST